MDTIEVSIPLDSIDLDKLETDDDLRREAQRLLPDALTRIGQRSAECAWEMMQSSLRGIPGFRVNSSSTEKSRFIQETGQNHCRETSAETRRAIEENIVQYLQDLKRRSN